MRRSSRGALGGGGASGSWAETKVPRVPSVENQPCAMRSS